MKENNHSNAAFGNSKAALILYEKIQFDKKLSKRIGRVLSNYNKYLNLVATIHSNDSLPIADIIYRSTLKTCDGFPEHVKSYATNVVKAKYKEYIKRMAV
jgi:hypothetical protein